MPVGSGLRRRYGTPLGEVISVFVPCDDPFSSEAIPYREQLNRLIKDLFHDYIGPQNNPHVRTRFIRDDEVEGLRRNLFAYIPWKDQLSEDMRLAYS